VVDIGPGIAYDVNCRGWVVGGTGGSGSSAFFWDGQSLTTIKPAGAGDAIAYAVNEAGVVALYATFSSAPWGQAFTWSRDGGLQALAQMPGQSWAEAWGINEAGDVVGWIEDAAGFAHATLWQGGARTDLGGLSAPNWSAAFDINDAGQVVGQAVTGVSRACFFDAGPSYIGAPDVSSAYAVNALGDVAGTTLDPQSGEYDAWARIDGQFVTVASGTSTWANDINDRRQVVGTAAGTAFLWQDGTWYDLNSLTAGAAGLMEATAINDCGLIVGGTDGGRAFLLVPDPDDPTDTDDDGLADVWELCGIDADHDGALDLRLPGADPEHKDLYVELDAMVGFAPTVAALQSVVDAFAAAPLANPDGNDGVALHFVGRVDPDDPDSGCDPCVDEDDLPAAAWGSGFAEYDALKTQHFRSTFEQAHAHAAAILQAKNKVFRYGLCAQSYVDGSGGTGSTGQAETPGNDFFISMGSVAASRTVTDGMLAGTIMHELGHTLGLRHGGDQADPRFRYKPNYFSVMNPLWQMPVELPTSPPATTADKVNWLWSTSWRLQYADTPMNQLDENALQEAAGLGGDATRFTLVGTRLNGSGSGFPAVWRMGGPIDWNLDGDAADSGVAEDVNYLAGMQEVAGIDVLTSPDDWSLVQFLPTGDVNWRDKSSPWAAGSLAFDPDLDELTADEYLALSTLRFDCNGNGIADDVEIDLGAEADANDNGIPDACEQLNASAAPGPSPLVARLRVSPPSPNPTDAVSLVAYELAAAGPVTVEVYDVRGHRVRRLWHGAQEPGEHQVTWDGRDDRGLPAASGTYLLRVDCAGTGIARPVVLRR